MGWFASALVVSGLALGVVGLLGWRQRLPRNRWAGVRTTAAVRDDETFAVANRVAAPLVLAAGAVALVGGSVALASPAAGRVLAVVGGIGAVSLLLAGGLLGDRAAARVPEPVLGGCGGVCTGCTVVAGCTAGPPVE